MNDTKTLRCVFCPPELFLGAKDIYLPPDDDIVDVIQHELREVHVTISNAGGYGDYYLKVEAVVDVLYREKPRRPERCHTQKVIVAVVDAPADALALRELLACCTNEYLPVHLGAAVVRETCRCSKHVSKALTDAFLGIDVGSPWDDTYVQVSLNPGDLRSRWDIWRSTRDANRQLHIRQGRDEATLEDVVAIEARLTEVLDLVRQDIAERTARLLGGEQA